MHNRLTAGNRLVEIQEEISGLLNEAVLLVRRHGVDSEAAWADAYWIPHIRMALRAARLRRKFHVLDDGHRGELPGG